jgi:hypothetical protein
LLSALFGRLEILAWLSRQAAWGPMVEYKCQRQSLEGTKIAQIAVMQGHVDTAQLALDLGAPYIDRNKQTCFDYVKKSNSDYVQRWGDLVNAPYLLCKDISKFQRLLTDKRYDSARKHLLSSRCLEIRHLHDECNIYRYTDTLSCGKSYKDVLSECINCIDKEDFSLWLFKLLSFERFDQTRPRLSNNSFSLFLSNNSFSLFWELSHDEDCSMRVDRKAPKDFARSLQDDKLSSLLELPSCKGTTIPNIQRSNPLLHYQIIPRQ